MKKAIFTICSVLTVCAVVFLACAKDDKYNQDGTHRQVTYAGQSTASSGGTGGNPNPNNLPSSSGYSTAGTTTGTTGSTTSTTVTPCSSALTLNGGACSGITVNAVSNVIGMNSSCGAVTMVFPGSTAPVAGTYVIVTGAPGANQCSFTCGSSAAGGAVIITTGSSNKATFSSIVCGTVTATGTACY